MRTQIGFKVTDNKLMLMPEQNKGIENINTLQAEKLHVLLEIASFLDEKMQSLSTSIVKHEAFSKYMGKDISEKLDKLYIKFYEPL